MGILNNCVCLQGQFRKYSFSNRHYDGFPLNLWVESGMSCSYTFLSSMYNIQIYFALLVFCLF